MFVGVTDARWYRHLAARPEITEVNFWSPGNIVFRVLAPGEPFAFKTHFPDNRIVGGGFFDGFVSLPISDAWRIFGPANGVDSPEELRGQIGRYRKAALVPLDDPEIGCVMLSDVTFFEDLATPPTPTDWSSNIVRGKAYDAADPQAESIVEALLRRDLLTSLQLPSAVPGGVFGPPRLVAGRLGQRPFQALVLDAYKRRCAVTGEKIRPVLQAAHIKPVASGGENRLDNGLLLRSDVHTLFDSGYLGLTRDHKLLVSPRIRSEFSNGEEFYGRAGSPIGLPDRRADRPNREFLEWHADTVFRAS